MIEATFQLTRGLGPRRERELWQAGVVSWRALAASASPLPSAFAATLERRLRAAVDEAAAAYADGDVERLAALLPSREQWRLFAAFADDAAYLDIETSDDVVGYEGISAIGVVDRAGPRLLLAGRDLDDFVERAADWKILVTFNGRSFDVPILRRAFPEWRPPACHIDLRHVLARLGHDGGLKSIERRLPLLGLRRPAHLDGIDGSDACWLYRRGRNGDRAAMRAFAEYNLYDAVNLRTLMAWAFNGMVEHESAEAPALRTTARALPVPARGDVLYDVSKILLAI
ncbi:MAG TPA: ribonuclease H-like domain-containing protein [Polyangia bacterium]|nr:ribonuclease H-like domain-containing protein [Polyangia bacterium]